MQTASDSSYTSHVGLIRCLTLIVRVSSAESQHHSITENVEYTCHIADILTLTNSWIRGQAEIVSDVAQLLYLQ